MKRLALAICGALFLGESFAATYYASQTGSGTTCSEASPCSLSYTIETKVVAGDTVIINPGTYSYDFNLTSSAEYNNVTITTTDAVKTALGTFNRGIPTGTDNRPLISGTFAIGPGLSGITIEYLQIRGGSTPDQNDNFWGIIDIKSPNTTIQYNKIYNGGAAIMIRDPSGRKTIRHNYMKDSGSQGGVNDTHMLNFCGNSGGCGGTGAQPPTSWTDKTLIEYNTLDGIIGGDHMQFVTASSNTQTKEAYVEFAYNDWLGVADENILDTKGANWVSIHDNRFLGGCSEGTSGDAGYYLINTTYDAGGENQANNNWYIFNNEFKPSSGCPGVFYAGGSTDNWYMWNNIIYNSITACFAYSGTNYLLNSVDYFVHNTVIQNNKACEDYIGGIRASSGVIKNNIFYNNNYESGDHGSISIRDGSGATVTHNFVYPTTCPSGWCTTGTSFQTSATPQVVDAANGNFNIASTSVVSYQTGTPLTDSGLFTPSLDKNGNSRVGKWSMGAIEYGSGTGDVIPPNTTIATIDPSAISTDSLAVIGSASDSVGVSGCKWRISSAPDGSNGTACTGTTSFSCATSGYANGANTLYVGCYDAAGNYGSDSITVNYTDVILATPSNLRILN